MDLGPVGKANIARLHIRTGDDQAAEQVLESLLRSWADDPQLPEAVTTRSTVY